MKVKLAPGTWADVDGIRYEPGDIVELPTDAARALIAGQSAVEAPSAKEE